ncbi:cation:proton antiporter [Neobacillus ginsengisoli]|uniref:Uncharacterized membrane-anchored protein YhcB (DUF1043 family) n=1 Tax=Neobacillus ginsengisoli TaxID=904295 RepID=A0ABT9XVX1_9BACI|nr:hypothetical protein [Neobacillus ginsengisoli]MDQ0199410.1 uncharacterized membrane-anchored protein YhcB (DUF1043 family) [Neobacillus ginsengisoli]
MIAVVVAGIIHALINERTVTLIAEEQVLTENIWSIVLFVLNGVVFLLLGLNIPSSMIETVANPNIGNWLAVGYVIAIGVVIMGIRFVWSYFFSYYEYRIEKTNEATKPDFKTSMLTSLTGVRGAVTMAGVLSIPFLTISGKVFPQRSLILFLAAGVILFTLIIATMFLPILSKGDSVEGENPMQMDLSLAKKKILLKAIKKIKSEINEENSAAAYKLMDEYTIMFNTLQPEQGLAAENKNNYLLKMKEIRLMALKVERHYIQVARDKGGMEEAAFETFEKFLDLREEALSNNVRFGFMYLIGKAKRRWKRYIGYYDKEKGKRITKLQFGLDIQLKALQAALQCLEEFAKQYEKKAEMVNTVILDYKRMINRLKTPTAQYNAKSEEQKEELRIKVMDIERTEIQGMYESGEISREQAKELRRFVNYIESVTLYEYVE